jgi:RNA recognition motif-containing protein
MSKATNSFQNLFITRLPRSYTDLDLAALFKTFEPRSAKIMVDPATGRSKGFGFIYFECEQDGKAAFDAMNGTKHDCPERMFTIIMQPSNHDGRIASAESRAVYLRNIPMAATKADVEDLLLPFGTITTFSLRPDFHGSAAWVVYVEYETIESAKKAMLALHQKWTRLPGPAPVIAKFADTDELKRERRKHRDAMERSNTDCISSQTLSPRQDDTETASLLTNPPKVLQQCHPPFTTTPQLHDTTNSFVALVSICSDDSSQPIFEQDVDNMSFNNSVTPCVTPRPSTTRSPGAMKYTHNPYSGQCFAASSQQ